jgi:hypothetical protein
MSPPDPMQDIYALKIEAIRSPETSAFTKPTLRYIPEDEILHTAVKS